MMTMKAFVAIAAILLCMASSASASGTGWSFCTCYVNGQLINGTIVTSPDGSFSYCSCPGNTPKSPQKDSIASSTTASGTGWSFCTCYVNGKRINGTIVTSPDGSFSYCSCPGNTPKSPQKDSMASSTLASDTGWSFCTCYVNGKLINGTIVTSPDGSFSYCSCPGNTPKLPQKDSMASSTTASGTGWSFCTCYVNGELINGTIVTSPDGSFSYCSCPGNTPKTPQKDSMASSTSAPKNKPYI